MVARTAEHGDALSVSTRQLMLGLLLALTSGWSAAAQDICPPAVRPDVEAMHWAESSGNDCERYHGRRVCNGPRRVPLLEGEAEVRARSLGVVGGSVARRATTGPAPEPWVEAARSEGARAAPDLLWPVPEGRLWRGFGPRRGFQRRRGRLVRTRRQHMHNGVDIGVDEGALIVAVNDGLVVYSDNGMHGYGNAVLIVHADGAVSMYAHCIETYVVPGRLVHRGEVIAAVGQTGITHGAHLHFEYRNAGELRDPLPHFVNIPERSRAGVARIAGASGTPTTAVEQAWEAVDVPPPSETSHDVEP